jgi:hypothetical protein
MQLKAETNVAWQIFGRYWHIPPSAAAGTSPPFRKADLRTMASILDRRDLTPAQRADVAMKLIEIMRTRAKARQGERTDLKQKNIRVNLPEGSDNIVPFPTDTTQVRDEVAKAAGVSPKTASDAMTVKDRGRPEDWKAVVDGKTSISGKVGVAHGRLLASARRHNHSLSQFDTLAAKLRKSLLAQSLPTQSGPAPHPGPSVRGNFAACQRPGGCWRAATSLQSHLGVALSLYAA